MYLSEGSLLGEQPAGPGDSPAEMCFRFRYHHHWYFLKIADCYPVQCASVMTSLHSSIRLWLLLLILRKAARNPRLQSRPVLRSTSPKFLGRCRYLLFFLFL